MNLEDQIRETLQRRAALVDSREATPHAPPTPGHGRHHPGGRASRTIAAVVAFGVFAVAAVFAWTALRPGPTAPPTSEASTPDTARVTCGPNGATSLATPAVRPQLDGVHIEVMSRGSGFLYTQQTDVPGHNWAQDLATRSGTSEVLLAIPPRTFVAVACFKSKIARDAGPLMDPSAFPTLRVGAAPTGWRGFYELGSLPDSVVVTVNADPSQTEPPQATFSYGPARNTIPMQGGHGWGVTGSNSIGYVLTADIPAGTPLEVRSNADSVRADVRPCCPVTQGVELHPDPA